MAITFPRISITVDDDRGTGTQGELNILALGFGIHQAWIYTAMFGTTTIFHAPQALGSYAESSISLVFLISIVVFGLSLLFAAATDQKLLKFYTAKRAIIGAAAFTAIGTFAVFAVNVPGVLGFAATLFAGVSTGIGSALLLLFWGIAFSRHGAATIVMNTAVAIVIAIALYSCVLHIIPPPFSGILTGCLPLLELPLLWRLTPVSYAVRHAIPIFNPLPVRKMPFSIRLALPTLLFGFALGALRSISTQIILPSSDLTTQLLALFAGGAATVLLLVTSFCLDKRSHWDFLFRPLIPFIAVTLFFLPTLSLGSSVLEPLVLLTGYMCFEALMWVFFGEMSQEFRLSPIFVFGIGRGCLALGSLAGSLSVADPSILSSLTPFGEAGGCRAHHVRHGDGLRAPAARARHQAHRHPAGTGRLSRHRLVQPPGRARCKEATRGGRFAGRCRSCADRKRRAPERRIARREGCGVKRHRSARPARTSQGFGAHVPRPGSFARELATGGSARRGAAQHP